MIVKDFNSLASICSIVERSPVPNQWFASNSDRNTYVGPFVSPGLYGVLNSGGLLAGSALTLDIEGVSNLRFVVLFPDLILGVFGTRPSNLQN
jgi:hypothetical protein